MRSRLFDIIITVITAGILWGIGSSFAAMLDFRDLKKQVNSNTGTIQVTGAVVCEVAIELNAEKAKEMCVDILKSYHKLQKENK